MANPSEPKIFPALKVCSRLFCQDFQPWEFFYKEKTPIFI